MTAESDAHARRTPEARRRQIVAVAGALFLEKGFEQTSLGDIIARTGGSRRDIYGFFGDKEGLFEAAMESLVGNILSEGVPQVLDLDGADIEADLTRLGRAFLTRILDLRIMAVIRQFIAVAATRPHLGRRAYEAGPQAFYSRIEAYLKRCVAKGDLCLDDTRGAARIFAEMLKGEFQTRALMTGETTVDEKEIDRHVRLTVKLFLDGARRTGPGPRGDTGSRSGGQGGGIRPGERP